MHSSGQHFSDRNRVLLEPNADGYGSAPNSGHLRSEDDGNVDPQDDFDYDSDSNSDSDEAKSSRDLIKLTNVHKTYLLGLEGVQALRGVNLVIRKGEFAMILGVSGGGKTTLLNLIGTIDKPTKGDLHLCGLRVTNSTDDKTLASIRLNTVAFVF